MLLESEMQKQLGDIDFETKHVENDPDFEKLAHVIQHGPRGFIVKKCKVSKQRQMILVTFIEVGLLEK